MNRFPPGLEAPAAVPVVLDKVGRCKLGGRTLLVIPKTGLAELQETPQKGGSLRPHLKTEGRREQPDGFTALHGKEVARCGQQEVYEKEASALTIA